MGRETHSPVLPAVFAGDIYIFLHISCEAEHCWKPPITFANYSFLSVITSMFLDERKPLMEIMEGFRLEVTAPDALILITVRKESRNGARQRLQGSGLVKANADALNLQMSRSEQPFETRCC